MLPIYNVNKEYSKSQRTRDKKEVQKAVNLEMASMEDKMKKNAENTSFYDVYIEEVIYNPQENNMGIMLTITDDQLLEKTGGIVQGMSGSPIIQNGKIVGAVTHVLVNDPTRGYGIFIENMLDAAG